MFPATLPPLLLTLRVLRSSAEVLGSLGLPANTAPNRQVVIIIASLIIEEIDEANEYKRPWLRWRRGKGKEEEDNEETEEEEKLRDD